MTLTSEHPAPLAPTSGTLALVPATHSESFVSHLRSGGHERWEMAYPEGTDPRENPLVMLKGGFSTRLENYQGLTNALARLGYTAVNCDALRDLPLSRAMHPVHLTHPLRRQSQAVWGVMQDLRERDFMAKPHLVGHSMAGKVMLDAAVHHPDETGTVVLFEPAGFGHHRAEICRQFATGVVTDAMPQALTAFRRGEASSQLTGIVKHVGRYGLQIAHEGVEIMGTDARALAAEYLASGHHIKFILGAKDRVIGNRHDDAVIALDPDTVIIDAGHTAPQFQSELSALAIHSVLQPQPITHPSVA